MLEHDCDTDEDCEVYFLKPVNEYNIVDKIKEANKELFGDGDSSESLAPEQRRKVQFRVELEEYEPNTTEETNQGEKDSAENGCYELLTLDEESDDNTVPNNQTIEECAEMLAMEVQKKIEAIQIKITESDDDIEEICEEIEVMDMDTGRRLEEDTKEMNSTKSESKDSPGHKESKEDGDESAEVTDCTGELREDDDDDDEDDKLSIIVASYLPPDPLACDDKCSGTKKKPFSRHFSFRRRKANCRSPEIANIKMNYKTCCEYRHSEGIRLPKYSGYMSEYGLSREQLEKREQSAQSKNKVVAEKSLKATEAEVKKMQDNERAFTTWLKNKMRFPINRTKNMFDVKKANNCMVASKSGIFRQK